MAPLKTLNKQQLPANGVTIGGVKTRSHLTTMKKEVLPKRKADDSPLKRATVKRSALVDIKNELKENNAEAAYQKTNVNKKASVGVTVPKKPLGTLNVKKTVSWIPKKETTKVNVANPVQVKVTESLLPKPKMVEKILINKKPEAIPAATKKTETSTLSTGVVTRRASRSSELEKSSESSLYVSALEDLNLDENKKASSKRQVRRPKPPPGVEDYDLEQMNDLGSVAMYAMDIFNYLKSRENHFKIDDYMSKQTSINKSMRALLIDWMVEIQENFELNHETLYLAVKIVDLYLSKVKIQKEDLQLVGCASLFIASKYDERIPPMLDDFLYICDHLYDAKDVLSMEIKLLRNLDFQLGIPLSYRFLRRYARCAKIDMPLLTLARFILEYSLMDYSTVTYSDSKMAAAALLLAIIMKQGGTWTPTLEYYSGYKVDDFKDIALALNAVLHKKQNDKIKTVRTKYSHKIFFEVAKIPLVDDLKL
ncbi:G2/mitotic-specific cyclin-B3 [Halyomorpha halys]|uniref:G2/mitotic-specific cyclin-B3 n=1 Tax=Halyomorpha halys TaxID=286706 RepID=UPI0006D4F7FC|nr:G2/mitotic-specific cyclin-B3 [Halyomorpha halys]XP_014292384.1 G2/mitotic-specific cyclin-B3 [Halyomorpha halys]XP_014292385.1 G2/mitotic-specific cyclin-B3 [Halyomorpha halys]